MEPKNALTILIVDDEKALAEGIAIHLLYEGHRVQMRASGEEALHVLDGVDVIITDFKMPGGMNGLGLIRCARTAKTDISAIVVSGGGMTDLEKAFLEENLGVPVLPKPFRIEELQAAIEKVTTS